MTRTVGPPGGKDELDAFSDVLTDSLNFPPRGQTDALSRYQPGDLRLVRDGDRVAGGLVLIQTGQFFGGARLAMTGIHAVAVAPQDRGSGAGRVLLQEVVRELAGPGGPPIACLFPATQPLYRSVGFEQAGTFTQYRIPIASLPIGPHDLAIERLPAESAVVAEALGPVYARWARRQNGFVDRTEWFWRRQVDPLGGEPRVVYVVREQGAITGYLFLRRRWQAGSHVYQDVLCRELCAETPAALQRLITLVADERSLAQSLIISGPPNPLDHMLLVEQSAAVDFQIRWMLRILDPAAALEARGYPRGLRSAIDFEIEDELLQSNCGHGALAVEGGQGRARRAAGGGLRLSIGVRGLSALFTGYVAAEELARSGLAAGSDDALAAATALFAGPVPWLPEIF